MSRKKIESGLYFSVVVPRMMEIAGLRRQNQLAELLEIKPQSISGYKSPGRREDPIPSDWIIKFMLKTHSSLADILGGKNVGERNRMNGNKAATEGAEGSSEVQKWGVDIHIPWLRKEYGMTQEDLVNVMLKLSGQWVEEFFSANKKDLGAWVMDSDNMEPAIHRNELLLVDRRFTSIKGAGVYLFLAGAMLVVRRVHIHLDGRIEINSDNNKYQQHAHVMTQEALETTGLGSATKVAGRVIFIGKQI